MSGPGLPASAQLRIKRADLSILNSQNASVDSPAWAKSRTGITGLQGLGTIPGTHEEGNGAFDSNVLSRGLPRLPWGAASDPAARGFAEAGLRETGI